MARRSALLLVCLATAGAAAGSQAAPAAPPSPAPARSEVDRVLEAWEAEVKSLTSFTCRFRQEKRVNFMRRPLISTGTIAYRDRRLLWKTETPAPGFLSVDGTEVRIYTPEFKTMEIVPLAAGDRGPALSGAFPGFTGDFSLLRERYSAELLPAEGDATARRLRFVPRREELLREVTAVEVTLDRESRLKAWRIVRADGDELRLAIEEFVAGAEVSDADLAFEVPPDVKIVRPLAPPAGGAGGLR